MGWFHSLTHAITHPVSTVESGVHALEDGASDVGHFVSDHWKGIVTFAVSAAAFAGIAALCVALPFAIPALATMAIAGVGSGVAAQLVSDWLDGRGPGRDLLYAGALSGAITVATFGAGKLLAPYAAPLLARVGLARAVAGASAEVAGGGASELASTVESGVARTAGSTPVSVVAAKLPSEVASPLLESVHAPEPEWLQVRMSQTLARIEAGESVPGASLPKVSEFLHETYEHVNEVNAILDEMGARSHPIPALASTEGALPRIHDFGERASLSRLEDLVRRVEANPLIDRRTGEAVPVPRWLESLPAETRAAGETTVDVSKLNPYVASGLGRDGPPDPYAIALHNLSDHHFVPAFENPDTLVETIADRVDAMRQARVYRPYPLPYDAIRSSVVKDVEKGILPEQAQKIVDDAIAAEQRLERTGKINPYYTLETRTADSTAPLPPAPSESKGILGSLDKLR